MKVIYAVSSNEKSGLQVKWTIKFDLRNQEKIESVSAAKVKCKKNESESMKEK